jgi:hypothetical protein
VKGDEARDVLQVTVPSEPDLLEIALGSFPHFEAVHGDEHACWLLSGRLDNICFAKRLACAKGHGQRQLRAVNKPSGNGSYIGS